MFMPGRCLIIGKRLTAKTTVIRFKDFNTIFVDKSFKGGRG